DDQHQHQDAARHEADLFSLFQENLLHIDLWFGHGKSTSIAGTRYGQIYGVFSILQSKSRIILVSWDQSFQAAWAPVHLSCPRVSEHRPAWALARPQALRSPWPEALASAPQPWGPCRPAWASPRSSVACQGQLFWPAPSGRPQELLPARSDLWNCQL